MHLATKFHHPTFSCIVLANKQTDNAEKCTLLHYATPVGNNSQSYQKFTSPSDEKRLHFKMFSI